MDRLIKIAKKFKQIKSVSLQRALWYLDDQELTQEEIEQVINLGAN